MKKFLLALCVGLSMYTYGQKEDKFSKDYSYKVSDPYRVVDADEKYYLCVNGKPISVKIDKRDIYIQRYQAENGNQISVKHYEDAYPKNAVIENVLEISGKVVLFYTQWEGKEKYEQLYAHEIDVETGEFKGQAKQILKIQGKVSGEGSGSVMDFNLVNKFIIYPSFNKQNFLVKFRRIPEKKRDKESFDIIGLATFNGELTQLESREVTMPYTERRMDNLDFQMDNKGNVFLLNKIFEDDSNKDKKRSEDKPNYHIELFTLKTGSSSFSISKVDSGTNFINSLLILDDAEGNMMMAGFYNKDLVKSGGFFSKGEYNGFDKYSNCDGMIYGKLLADGTVSPLKTIEIPTELLNQNESKKAIRKNEKKEEDGVKPKFTDLRFRKFDIQKDGSVILVAEQYYVKSHTTAGGPNSPSRTYYTYHYNDILISRILPAGNLGWVRKIPKSQFGKSGRGTMGFDYFRNDSDNFLIFFDHPENATIDDTTVPKTYKDRSAGDLAVVRIDDATGTVKKGNVLNIKDVEDYRLHQISMSRNMKIAHNAFMMEAYKKGKEDIMVRIELK